jgi:hypothetical protein
VCSKTVRLLIKNQGSKISHHGNQTGTGWEMRRVKTANIWKSFQLWRKETKCRGYYFNFIQFSALKDAQEILYANSFKNHSE